MPVLVIEIDEVREDEIGVRLAHQLERLLHPVRIRLRSYLLADADAIENIRDLAEADHLPAGIVKALHDRFTGRRDREVLPVRRSFEVAFAGADERPRDDSPNVVRAAHQLAR